jgi:HEAT repeat protein
MTGPETRLSTPWKNLQYLLPNGSGPDFPCRITHPGPERGMNMNGLFRPNIKKLQKQKKIARLAAVMIENRNRDIRDEAAAALLELKHPDAVSPLLEQIGKDSDWQGKYTALRILLAVEENGETDQASPVFHAQIEAGDPGERLRLYGCADQLPNHSASRLLAPWVGRDQENYPFLVKELLWREYPDVLDPLLSDGTAEQVKVILQTLEKMGETGAKLLIDRFRGRNRWSLKQARIHGRTLLSLLLPCLETWDSWARTDLLKFILALKLKAGTRAIDCFFSANFPENAKTVLYSLTADNLVNRSVTWVEKGLAANDLEVRQAAVNAAVVFPPGYLNKLLLNTVKGMFQETSSLTGQSPCLEIIRRIIEIICRAPDDAVLEFLEEMLENYARYRSIFAGHLLPLLEKAGPPLATLLLDQISSPDEELRIQARNLARREDPERLIQVLVRELSLTGKQRRDEAGMFLEMMKWTPQTPLEQCWWAAASERWEELGRYGRAAIPVLEWMLENGILLEQTAATLRTLDHVPEQPEIKVVFHIAVGQYTNLAQMGPKAALLILDILEQRMDQLTNRALNTAIAVLETFLSPGASEITGRLREILRKLLCQEINGRQPYEFIRRVLDNLIRCDQEDFLSALDQWLDRDCGQALMAGRATGSCSGTSTLLEYILKNPHWQAETLIPFLLDLFARQQFRKFAGPALVSLAAEYNELLFKHLMQTIRNSSLELRRAGAELLLVLSASGFLNSSQWNQLNGARQDIQARHKDYGTDQSHRDYQDKDGWCIYHVDEAGSSHTDKGIGVALPAAGPPIRLYGNYPAGQAGIAWPDWMEQGLPVDDLVQAASASSPATDDLVLAGLNAKDWRRRAAAVQTVMPFHGTEVQDKVLALLHDPEIPVQLEAIRTIDRVRLHNAVPALKKLLDHSNTRIAENVSRTLETFGWQPGDREQDAYWQRTLKSPDPQRRIQGIRKLVSLNIPQVEDILLGLLDDPEPVVRQTISQILAEQDLAPRENSSHYITYLADTGQWIRLQQTGSRGIEAFRKVLADPPENLSLSDFVSALLRLSMSKGERLIADEIESGRDPEFSARLIAAWGQCPSPIPGTHLAGFVKMDNGAVRLAAAGAALSLAGKGEPVAAVFFQSEQDPDAVVSLLTRMSAGKTILCPATLVEMAGICDKLNTTGERTITSVNQFGNWSATGRFPLLSAR